MLAHLVGLTSDGETAINHRCSHVVSFTWGLGSSRSSPLKPILFLYATAPFMKLARLSSSNLDAAPRLQLQINRYI